MFPMPSPIQDEGVARWCIERRKDGKFGTIWFPLCGITGSFFVFGFGGIFLVPVVLAGGVLIGIYRWTSGDRLEKEGEAIYEALGRAYVHRHTVQLDRRTARPLAPNS
jgi:hypothetical protein